MKDFKQLGVSSPVLKAISEEDFKNPTKIQEKTIPLVLEGKDVMAGSATGSGKTLAFGIGMIQNTTKDKGIQGLVLAPTRELAKQVKDELEKFSRFKELTVTTVYGGVSIKPQIQKLKNTDIVVATPGRLLDHMNRKTINLENVKTVVLDEADRMLDMGFIDDVKRILKKCPKDRQTLLFSATISGVLNRLAEKYMNNPKKVSIDNQVDPTKLKQVYYDVKEPMKFSLLVHLLEKEDSGLVMVFCNTRKRVDFVSRNLNKAGINAKAIHGGFSQNKREKTMKHFNSKDKLVLVCTDVAGRGIHVEGISHVYNYDVPRESKQYMHRIGRTARAGEEGKAINLVSPDEHDYFRRIIKDNGVDIEKKERPYIEKINTRKSNGPFKEKKDVRGTIKFFNQKKKYGFVEPDKGNKDLFVHENEADADSLEKGDRVKFDAKKGKKGPKATNVKKIKNE